MRKIIVLLLTILLLSCNNDEIEVQKKYYSTGSVFSGSINIKDSFIGYIEGKNVINLSPKVGGKITSIYVKEGDYIKKGDLLVTLDSLESKAGYSTAENIIESLNKLKLSTSEMFDEQINSMKSKVKQVEISKKGSKEGLNDIINITNSQLETAKLGVETAKINFNHTKTLLKEKEKNIYDNSKGSIVSSLILYTNIVEYIDNLLGITLKNKDKNNKFENYLSAKNSSYLITSKDKFLEVNKLFLEYKLFYDDKIDGKEPENNTILIGLDKGEYLAEKLKNLLDSTYSVLDNSIENTYLSTELINNYKSNILVFGNNIESLLVSVYGDYILGLRGSRQGLLDFEKSYNMQIDLLNKELELAEKNYTKYENINDGQLRESSIKYEISSSSLEEIKFGLDALIKQKETKINEINSKINEVQGQKIGAGVMINNGKIFSPIDGVVISKNFKVGEVTGGGIPILFVANQDSLKINILLSEEQSKIIKLYDNVLLEIEGINEQVNGIITNIFPSKDLITKKINIEISLKNIGNNIKIGSYTKVIFNNFLINSGIIIPNSSIISRFMIPGVYVLDDGITKFKNIEIIDQNDNFSEIKGLNIGEIIIIDGKENIGDGEKL